MNGSTRKEQIRRYRECKDPIAKAKIWAYIHATDSIKTRKYNRGRVHITKKQRIYKKQEQIVKLRKTQEPGEDGVYLYVQSFEKRLYKVGISDNVIARNKQLQYQGMPNNAKLDILYIGKPLRGRAKDAEYLAHCDLYKCNEEVVYQDGTKSREWFRCDLDNLLFYLNLCIAEMKKYENNNQ
jgi:hypothetical protein